MRAILCTWLRKAQNLAKAQLARQKGFARMGSRGPIPQGAEIRALHHVNKSGRRVLDWQPAAKLPRCPARLTGYARSLWNSLGRSLLAEGLMSALYASSFEMLCTSWGRLLQIEEELRSTTDPKERAALRRLAIQQSKLTQALAGEFGLTPNAKERVQSARKPPTPRNPWSQFGPPDPAA
jgi:phage terminase small subunit